MLQWEHIWHDFDSSYITHREKMISRRRRLMGLGLLVAVVMMAGCDIKEHAPQSTGNSADQDQTGGRVKALVGKSIATTVFIDGGGFWIGDFGVLMDAKSKERDVRPGADAKPAAGLPFTTSEDNRPPSWVTLDGYSIQKYKVTYEDFDVYVAANGLPKHPPEGDESLQSVWRSSRTSGDVPAGVTWQQAKGYCQWLAKESGLAFDLPTEAQWEYAASARTNSYRQPYPTETGLLKEGVTHPSFKKKAELLGDRGAVYGVGRFAPSKLGLYDLVGNGFDWVDDWYASDAYAKGGIHNPKGPQVGKEKVLRGMSASDGWTIGYPHLMRYHNPPDGPMDSKGERYAPARSGFRCVINEKLPHTKNLG